MITVENIASHEFVGLQTEIIKSSNQQLIGLNGVITNETKNMITLKTQNIIRKIPKSINSWKFIINNQSIVVDGKKITKRPFERIGVKA